MNEIVERKFAGDVIDLKIWRDKEAIEKKVTLKRFLPYLIAARKYDEKPRYVMYAGLVFQPLDRNLMAAHNMKGLQVRYHFDSYVSADIYKERPEVIVLTSILPDSINSYFTQFSQSIVDKVNGIKVKNLTDVHTALSSNDDQYIVINLLGNGRPIVIEKSKVKEAQQRIQTKYNIIKDHYLGENK